MCVCVCVGDVRVCARNTGVTFPSQYNTKASRRQDTNGVLTCVPSPLQPLSACLFSSTCRSGAALQTLPLCRSLPGVNFRGSSVHIYDLSPFWSRTMVRIQKHFALSRRLFWKSTEMVGRVLTSVSYLFVTRIIQTLNPFTSGTHFLYSFCLSFVDFIQLQKLVRAL